MKHIYPKVFLIDLGYISTELMDIPSNEMIGLHQGITAVASSSIFPG